MDISRLAFVRSMRKLRIHKDSAVTAEMLRVVRFREAEKTAETLRPFFAQQADAMARIYMMEVSKHNRSERIFKDLAETIIARLIELFAIGITQLLQGSIVSLCRVSWPIWSSALNAPDDPFSVTHPVVLQALLQAGNRIGLITNTVRNELRKILLDATREGLGPIDTADRIRTIMTERYRNQAMTIARTELGYAHAEGTYWRYRSSGVTHVKIMDNGQDDPDEECARLNNTTQTLEWYRRNQLGHPNCTRAAGPIIDED